MGVSERRERDREATKNLIIDTAYKMIENDGVENLSIRKIAKVIEYSPMTIYGYFKNKEEIMFAISNKAHDYFLKKSNMYLNKDPEARIRSRLREYWNFGINNPNIYKAIWSSGYSREGSTNKVFLKNDIGMLSSDIGDGIKKNIFKDIDTDVYSSIIWASIHGLTLTSLKGENPDSTDIQISSLINLIIDGLR